MPLCESREMLLSAAAGPASTYVPLPSGATRANPLCEVESGAGALPCTRNPKKTLPWPSVVSGVLMKTVAVNPPGFA